MLNKYLRNYTLGFAALLVLGSAIYILNHSAPSEPKVTVAEKKEAPSQRSNEISPAAPAEADEDVEDVYVFPQPENFSSNPPREDWEEKLIQLVRGPDEDLAKADQLLSRIPSLPDEGKLVAMEHAAALIPDEAYGRYRPQLFALSTNDELREAVMVDVLSRDDTIRFTTMLEIMKNQQGAIKQEVHEILVAYLDHDYGPDARAWEGPLRQFLADNQD